MAANRVLPMHVSGAETVTLNSPGYNVDRMKSGAFFLNVSAASGTIPTLNVKIQDSPNGTDWYDLPSMAFTQATGVTSQRLSFAGPLGLYVRAVQTIGGTTPSFTYSLDAILNEV